MKILDETFQIHDHGYFISNSSRDGFCDPGIMKELISFFTDNPGTVLDLGCGDGRYIKGLREIGIKADGYDGNPYTPEITKSMCKVWDLTEVKKLEQSYDWILCLEVGEHIDKKFEDNLILNIHLNNKRGVILSWAVPGQGGTSHVNCQTNEYVQSIFEKLGYTRDFESEKKFRDSCTNCYWFKDTVLVFRRSK